MGGDGWVRLRLGDVCTKIGSGATPRGGSSVYLDHGEVALIRSQNIYNDGFQRSGLAFISTQQADQLSNVEVHPDDVLLNITGDSVARCCLVDASILPARVNQHVAIIRPAPDRLHPRYLRYFMVSPRMQSLMLSWAATGGTRKALTKKMIESFEISAPKDTREQLAIARILGTLDDKIELNRRTNETLEAMAQALFKSWFVDFDPVVVNALKASNPIPDKFAERAAHYRKNPDRLGLPDHILRLFPDRFVNSELGPIPEGWSTATVGEEFRVTMGQSPPSATYNEQGNGLPFFQGRRDFRFRYPVYRVYCTAPTRTANAGDTLVSVRAPVGDINMALETCCIGRGVAAVRHKSGSRSYTYYAMRAISQQLRSYESDGTVFGAITKKQFQNVPHIAPDQESISFFETLTYPADEKIRALEEQARVLARIRDTLLPKLLSGELRVPDVETIMEDVQ